MNIIGRRLIMPLLAIISLGLTTDVVGQQLNDEGALAKILDSPDDANVIPNRDSLKAALQLLLEQTAQIRSTLDSPTNGNTIPETTSFIDEKDREQIRDITKRIELLKKIYDEKRTSPAINQSPENDAAFQENSSGMSAVQAPLDEMLNFAPVEPADSSSQDQSPQEFMAAERVLPQPVNLFEMGNSLFQTGNLSAALEAYQSVDRSKITAFDSMWLDYMTACCHRKLGNAKEAEAMYREIANIKSGENPVGSAREWLRYMATKSEAEYVFAQLDSEIDALLQKAQTHVDE